MNENVSNHEIGIRLRELRGVRTRTGVAKQIGISYSALCQYEYGIKLPNDATKVKIANYYGKSVQDIFFNPKYDETT